MQEVGFIQVDPLNVVGRSHDLALCSRVENYRPALLDDALYRKRTLFEWGGNLRIRPIEELPYLLPLMRVADYKGRRKHFFRTHTALVARVLKTVEAQGPIGGRDLEGGAGVDSYRARKDTGLALYYLWHRGDLMIHSRRRGERLYDLTSRLVPQRWLTCTWTAKRFSRGEPCSCTYSYRKPDSARLQVGMKLPRFSLENISAPRRLIRSNTI